LFHYSATEKLFLTTFLPIIDDLTSSAG